MNSLNAIHRAVSPAPELLLGMGITQIIATAQVYTSNLRLFAQMSAIADAGFLPVPNRHVLPRLLDLGTAFWVDSFLRSASGPGWRCSAWPRPGRGAASPPVADSRQRRWWPLWPLRSWF